MRSVNFSIATEDQCRTTRHSPEVRVEQSTKQMLIRRIRDGEHDLFYELIRPLREAVYGAAFAILRNEADAEDAAQEAVLKAFKHIRQFRAEARFSTWLIQITVNEARMRRRKKTAHMMEPMLTNRTNTATIHLGISPTGERFLRKLWNGERSGRNWPRRWPRSAEKYREVFVLARYAAFEHRRYRQSTRDLDALRSRRACCEHA